MKPSDSSKTRSRLTLATIATLAFTASPFALARSQLVASSPADAQVLAAPPIEIRLTFNEHVDPRGASIKLVSDKDKHYDADRPHANRNDPQGIAASVPVLRPGTYRAHWTAIGADGRRMRGDFSFTVK